MRTRDKQVTFDEPRFKALAIGPLTIDPPVVLAPMAGYTRAPFRVICQQMGCRLVYTEMVTAEGVSRRSPPTMRYLDIAPGEGPIGTHIYGVDPDAMAKAAEVIESLGRFDLIDVNCGCPVPKVTRKGAGVALMRQPETLRRIVAAMVQATSLPVTVKTRLGVSREQCNVSEVAHAVEEGGAAAIAIHARFATDRHAGSVDLAALKRVKAERGIPVIGNGGVTSPQDAFAMQQKTGVDGVMVGRGALGNPWLFRDVNRFSNGESPAPPTDAERRAVIAQHLEHLYQVVAEWEKTLPNRKYTSEQVACRMFRGHLSYYLAGMRGVRQLKKRLMKMESIEAVMAGMDEVLRANASDGASRQSAPYL